jgi:membrane protease YdiL (CAAX protease family)
MGAVAAVLITATLFGLFHLDLYRLIPATILGV